MTICCVAALDHEFGANRCLANVAEWFDPTKSSGFARNHFTETVDDAEFICGINVEIENPIPHITPI